MNRRFDLDVLRTTLVLRGRMLRVLLADSDKTLARSSGELRSLIAELKVIASRTAGLPESRAIRCMRDALAVCYHLARWVAAQRGAQMGADRFLAAAKARAASLGEELLKPLAFSQTQQGLIDWSGRLATTSDVPGALDLFRRLARIPLPVIYSIRHDPYAGVRLRRAQQSTADAGEASSSPPVPLVKLAFTLDGQALATPQIIGSGRLYGLGVRAMVNRCPPGQRILELDYVTTMSAADYAITPFLLEMSDNEQRASAEASGQLIIRPSQSSLSPPASFKVRARFVNPDRAAATPAIVIGYNELRLCALDQASFPVLSRYPMVDIQIPKIMVQVRESLPDVSPNDADDFLNCLVCLGAYCGMVQQSGIFRGRKVDEKRDFQQHILQHLRTMLGDDVREEETLAGGRPDLRYRRIVIELKVDDTTTERELLRKKYIEQPTQYAVSSIPLGIVCILDLSEKVHPPSNVANNITLETPPVHGFATTSPPYPTKIAVVIIDGNLRSPSEYSKSPSGTAPKKKAPKKPKPG